jgi:hypothetical protein
LEQIHELEDCQQNTDDIGRLYVDRHGPFSVYITAAICECFGVINLDEITCELLRAEREAWERLPKQQFIVTIQRVGYSEAERPVFARSESEARRAALESAGDIDFSNREHHAEYFVAARAHVLAVKTYGHQIRPVEGVLAKKAEGVGLCLLEGPPDGVFVLRNGDGQTPTPEGVGLLKDKHTDLLRKV